MNARRARGQSLVELALVAPILILLAMSVWDGGSVLREQVVLQQAARDGARVAATGYGTAVLDTVVANAVIASARDLPALSSTPGYVTISYPGPQSVQVRVNYAHSLITPVLRQLWAGGSGTIGLQASATFYLPQLTPVPATLVVPTATPSPTLTPTPSATSSPTRTSTPTLSPTVAPTRTPTPTLTPTPAPRVTLNPTSLNFGAVEDGEVSGPQTITVTNSGNAPLNITLIDLIGAAPSDYAVGTQTCTGRSIAPTGTCTISISFAPSQSGLRSATLRITDNAPGSPHLASLSGTGTGF